jgi:hypothetical protein
VYDWLKKYGRNYREVQVMRIEKPGEVDRLKRLEREKQELETALAQAHLKILALESTLSVAEDEYGIDFKKNFGTNRLRRPSSSSKKE